MTYPMRSLRLLSLAALSTGLVQCHGGGRTGDEAASRPGAGEGTSSSAPSTGSSAAATTDESGETASDENVTAVSDGGTPGRDPGTPDSNQGVTTDGTVTTPASSGETAMDPAMATEAPAPTTSVGGEMTSPMTEPSGVCGGIVCNELPNVLAGAETVCQDGRCVFPSTSCAEGFAHCSEDLESGCETYLGEAATCGACGNACPPASPVCTKSDGQFVCATACIEQTPDFCDGCVSLATSLLHCGACDTPCASNYNQVQCVQGECVHGDCYPGHERCSGGLECEPLNTPQNCGACGRDDCGAENASVDCTDPDSCGQPTCNTGYANCDRTSPDCETEFGGGCTPEYVGTLRLDVADPPVVARASDNVTWLAGTFSGEVDLDPTATSDIRDGGVGGMAYVSKLDADGNYGWSIAIGNAAIDVSDVAPGASGSVLITGTLSGMIDFDPGPGNVELGIENSNDQAYVARYGGDGELLWARAWPPRATYGLDVVSDGSGNVYCAGSFNLGTKDIDPTAGVDEREMEHAITGFLVKLDPDGNYLWGDVRKGAVADLAASATDVWTAGGTFEQGTWTYPGGARRTYWPDFGSSLVTTSAGVVMLGGSVRTSLAPPDFPEERLLVYGTSAATLLHLRDDGTSIGVNLLPDEVFIGLGAAPGGAVVLTESGSVLGYDADGTSAYRFQSGAGSNTMALVESPDGFLLVGKLAAATDLDPGPAADVIESGVFVSEFRF